MAVGSLFKVFMWKNLLFLRFNWLVLSIILIGCFAILTVYLKSTYKLLKFNSVIYDTKDADTLRGYVPANEGDYIFFSPVVPFTESLMKSLRIDLQLPQEKLKMFGNSAEMMSALENSCRGSCFAIEFQNYPGMENSSLNNERNVFLRYSLSSTTIRISPKKRYVNDEEVNGIKDNDDYIHTGVLTLQNLIDKHFIYMQMGQYNCELTISSLPSIGVEVMDSQRVTHFGSIFAVLANILLLSTFLVPLVEEKQDGIKEFLALATPFHFLNGVTFFLLRFLMYLFFLTAVFVVAFKYHSLGIAPVPYILVMFVLYMISAMCYAYLISVCFNSVFYAKVGGSLLFVMPFIFYLNNGKISAVATYLFSTKCFMEGLNIFQIFTNKHRQFAFGDIFLNITDASFNLLSIYLILVCQCFLYFLLYNYLSCIFPGRGGQKKPYLFFMKRKFFMKQQRNQYTTNERNSASDVAIIIQDLVKNFNSGTREIKIANRLNMEIKNKQITVLLGHNGAGKTTTLNMIMGSVPKDSGKILVCSERDVTSYRHLIGYCPQHNVFMRYMTCNQHLIFFAQLRGTSNIDESVSTEYLLKQLNLLDKKNEYARNLSGGMRRRLSLGIAICGDTRVIVLDEPSSGLDIQSRRELWDVMLKLRKSKAILVTTHHMEEAEVLGDTICILANGRLEHKGSPLELKRKGGSGYVLKLRTEKELFNKSATMAIIQETSPSAAVMKIVQPTVLVSLPYTDRNNYSKILQSLEENQNALGIHSIAVSDTSLEDVFLNCTAVVDEVDSQIGNRFQDCAIQYEPLQDTSVTFLQQFLAVFYKKYIYMRNEPLYILMLLLPFLSAGLAILLMFSSMSLMGNENALELNLQQFKGGVIYIKKAQNGSGYNRNIADLIKDLIEINGIQTRELKMTAEDSTAKELLRIQQNDLAYFLQNVVGAIEIVSSENYITFNIYFSGNIYHSSVALVNLVDNTILKIKGSKDSKIEARYVPIRRIVTDVSPARLEYYAVILPIGLFLYMFLYVSLPFNENKSDFKNLQAMPRFSYWFSVFTFDGLLHLFVCVILGIFQSSIMPEGLYSNNELFLIMMSVLFYGLSYLPILYILANAFRSISTLSTYLLFMFIVSAIVPVITSGNFQAMKHHKLTISLLSILPDFNLNHQLRVINENFFIVRRNSLVESMGSHTHNKESPDIGYFFFFATAVFFITTIFFVYFWENNQKRLDLKKVLSFDNCKFKLRCDIPTFCEDAAPVRQEKFEVESILKENKESQYPLVVYELLKLYGQKLTVRNLNFAVKKRECFGLLGVNGAGKTTSFQMLTGNCPKSSGVIKIFGMDILKNEAQYKYFLGYCPQRDCLNNYMTSYQILKYMARLRGVRASNIHSEVMYWLCQLDLLKHRDVLIRYYSGGTKRKLNAAIAMIGNPAIVFLDEPTTGVDPMSRRFLWKCVQDFQNRDKTIVLTSHSMDECEQLCNRLAIMSDGQLKCIGFVPDLKQKYGTGFTVSIKMKVPDTHENVYEITTHIRNHFPNNKLRENHAGMLTYFVETSSKIAWSIVFNKMEMLFSDCKSLIEDYSVNESKLEDIILTFGRKDRRLSESFHEI